MSRSEPLDRDSAEAIYDILQSTCGASARSRGHFVDVCTRRHETEWRFMGKLGVGGKFWRTTGRRADGSWGEVWCVNQYPEDETPDTRVMIDAANEQLAALQV